MLTIKWHYLRNKTPSHFMLSAMALLGREMPQNLRIKVISLCKKGEGYKKISKALLISQITVANVIQKFKKDETAIVSLTRPGCPHMLTPRHECLLMRRVEENRHTSSSQLAKEVESQTGVTVSHDTKWLTPQRNDMHGCHPRRKPSLNPWTKSSPRICHGPFWKRWRPLEVYTLEQ